MTDNNVLSDLIDGMKDVPDPAIPIRLAQYRALCRRHLHELLRERSTLVSLDTIQLVLKSIHIEELEEIVRQVAWTAARDLEEGHMWRLDDGGRLERFPFRSDDVSAQIDEAVWWAWQCSDLRHSAGLPQTF